MQGQDQLFPDEIVAPPHDHHELVAARSVHRAVLEDIADHAACLANVLIARLVAEGVVDDLQAVDIADRNGKVLRRLGGDVGIHLLFLQEKGVLALDAGQGVGKGDGRCLIALFQGFLFPALHGDVVCQHDGNGEAEKRRDEDQTRVVRVMNPGELVLKEGILVHGEGLFIRGAVYVVVDLLHDGIFPALIEALGPGRGKHDDEGQQGNPDDDGLAEVSGVILPDDAVEENQAEDGPGNQKGIGLRLDGVVREDAGEAEIDQEDHQNDHADAADDAVLSVVLLPGDLIDRGGGKAVEDGGAEGGGIHDPADGRPAQERNGQRDERHQHDGVDGDLFVIELGIALGEDAVLRRGIAEAADGAQHADQAGQNQRHQGEHQDVDAGPAEIEVCRVEGGQARDAVELVQTADIVQPAAAALGVGGDAHQDNEDVQRGDDRHRDDENAEQIAVLKPILLSGVGHAFKADKGPGRDEGNAYHLAQGAFVGEEGRRHAHARGGAAQHGNGKAEGDADRKDQDEDLHQAGGGQLALRAQQRHQTHDDQRDGRLAGIDLIAEDRVEIPDLEDPPEEIARKERNAGGVCPENGDVGQEHEPGREEGAVIAEDMLDIVVKAARAGIVVAQVVIVTRHHQHHEIADQQAEGRAEGACLGEIGPAGNDQGAPADGRAHRQGPDRQRRKIGLQFCLLIHTG